VKKLIARCRICAPGRAIASTLIVRSALRRAEDYSVHASVQESLCIALDLCYFPMTCGRSRLRANAPIATHGTPRARHARRSSIDGCEDRRRAEITANFQASRAFADGTHRVGDRIDGGFDQHE